MIDSSQFQLEMHQNYQKAFQKGLIAVLDVGSAKIVCFILRINFEGSQKSTEKAGFLQKQRSACIVGAAVTQSQGVSFGEINAVRETARAILKAIQAAQTQAGVTVSEVIVSMAGGNPLSNELMGSAEVTGTKVSDENMASVLFSCGVPDFGKAREVIHLQALNFAVDSKLVLGNPRGRFGSKLTAKMHLTTVDFSILQHLCLCLKRCDLKMAGFFPSAYVSGLSNLLENEKEHGAACIDIGADLTSISIFQKNIMIYSNTLQMGGYNITDDISLGLQVPLSKAERVKIFYGGAYAIGEGGLEQIKIGGDTGNWEYDNRTVSRTALVNIIKPRAETMLGKIRECLNAAGFKYLPDQKIVFTGGGCQIFGFDNLAKHILGHQVRLAHPFLIKGLPEATTGPAFSSALGLCMAAESSQTEMLNLALLNPQDKTQKQRTKQNFNKGFWANDYERASYLKNLLKLAKHEQKARQTTPCFLEENCGKVALTDLFDGAFSENDAFQSSFVVDDIIMAFRQIRFLKGVPPKSTEINFGSQLKKIFIRHQIPTNTKLFQQAYSLITEHFVEGLLTKLLLKEYCAEQPWVTQQVDNIEALVRSMQFEGFKAKVADEYSIRLMLKKVLGSLQKDTELFESAYDYISKCSGHCLKK
jgi:cell division protein FtsA